MPQDVAKLSKILSEPNYLRLSLRRLASLCLIKLKELAGRIETLTVHRILCSWALDHVTSSNKEVLLVIATRNMGKATIRDSASIAPMVVGLPSLSWEIPTERINIEAFKHCFSAVQECQALQKDLDPAAGQLRVTFARVLRYAA